jgi:tetratricopeptide (TPR) repeat protein
MQDTIALPPRHPNRSYPLANIADVYLRQGRFAKAETLLRDALAIRRENLPEGHTLISEAKSGLGEALTNLGNYAEAESLLLDAHTGFLNERGADDPRTKKAAELLTGLENRRAGIEPL